MCSLRKVYQEAIIINNQLEYSYKNLKEKYSDVCKEFETRKKEKSRTKSGNSKHRYRKE